MFASIAINPAGANGLIYGNYDLIKSQLIAVVVTGIYSFVVTAIILKVLDARMGLRVPDHEEIAGLDITQHGEKAYV
jgi:Amt family ammonium transporter